jgi:hypothetical protein
LLEFENSKLEDNLIREETIGIYEKKEDDGMDALIRQKELELSDLKSRKRSQSPSSDLELLRMKIQQAKKSDIDTTYNRLRSSIENFSTTPEKLLSQSISQVRIDDDKKLPQQHGLNSLQNNAFGKHGCSSDS